MGGLPELLKVTYFRRIEGNTEASGILEDLKRNLAGRS